MIKHALSCEIIVSWLLWLKLKGYKGEGFPIDHTYRWESSESFGWILEKLEIHRGVTSVNYLHSLIY